MRKKTFKELIRGDEWIISLSPKEKFTKEHSDRIAAVTLINEKEIAFSTETINLVVVLHELFHAYASYLCMESANLDVLQAEEIFAELFGSQGPNMYKQGLRIFSTLKKLNKPENLTKKQKSKKAKKR